MGTGTDGTPIILRSGIQTSITLILRFHIVQQSFRAAEHNLRGLTITVTETVLLPVKAFALADAVARYVAHLVGTCRCQYRAEVINGLAVIGRKGQIVALAKDEELQASIAVGLHVVQRHVTVITRTGGIDRQSVGHQEALHVALQQTDATTTGDISRHTMLYGGRTYGTIILPHQDFVHTRQVHAGIHFKVRIPSSTRTFRILIQHHGVLGQLNVIGHLFSSFHSLCQEVTDMGIHIKRIIGMNAGTGPIGITRHTARTAVVFFIGSLIKSHTRLHQQGNLLVDTIIGQEAFIVQQFNGLVQITQDKVCDFITRHTRTMSHQVFLIIGHHFSNDRIVAIRFQAREVSPSTQEIHLTNIMIGICIR